MMTAPTHILSSTAVLFLASVILRCLNTSPLYIAFTVLAGLIPDIDTNKSVIGFIFHRIIYLFSFGRIDLSKYVEHRGFFHSIAFLILLSVTICFINAKLIPYLWLGFLSHVYLDSFQKTGVKLLGFGNHWARFSLKYSLPMRSPAEYAILASSVLVIFLSATIINKGGSNHIIRKGLGTLRASVEDINALKDYKLYLVVNDGTGEQEYEIIDALGNDAIVLLDGNVPVQYGYRKDCQLQASGNKSYIRKEAETKTIEYDFILKDFPLSDLYQRIDLSYFYYLSGRALLDESVDIPHFFNRYNTITASGKNILFSYARLDDLKIYNIENKKVSFGDFKVTYKVKTGQDIPALDKRVRQESSEDIRIAQKRIADLKSIIDGTSESLSSIADSKLKGAIREKAKELLKIEENNLLRIRSIRKE